MNLLIKEPVQENEDFPVFAVSGESSLYKTTCLT